MRMNASKVWRSQAVFSLRERNEKRHSVKIEKTRPGKAFKYKINYVILGTSDWSTDMVACFKL